MSEPALRRPVGTRIWHCTANHITCSDHEHAHMLRFHPSGFAVDQRRIDGHMFLACQNCKPTRYVFGVVTSRPSPMVTLYEISKRDFEEWNNSDEDSLPTPEMLHRLHDPDGRSYNPYWTPRTHG